MPDADDDIDIHNNAFNVQDVEKALGKLKIGKTPGLDGILRNI